MSIMTRLVGASFLCCVGAAANVAPIVITYETTAAGRFGDQLFRDVRIVLTGFGDSENAVFNGGITPLGHDSATLHVDGLGAAAALRRLSADA